VKRFVTTNSRKPLQDRSQRTAERVLKATLELIAENGLNDLTIAGVAKRSRATNGSIYHLFGDKETLVRQAHVQFLEKLETALTAGISASGVLSTTQEVVRGICSSFVETFSENGRLLQAFLVEGRVVDSLRERGTETALRVERLAVSVIQARSGCDEAKAVWAVYLMISAQVNHLIFGEPMFMTTPPESQDLFVNQLSGSLVQIIS